ncbi:tRNA dihydrouridine(20/20a) synthase DusA [Endozoicomonas elysicola]|uniref:tRNA-dihydrouridine(20/20a) synthase n=1 Tax=Endozoicomonas elysicola TaxID=305900 RepID=A0A081KAX3_9GAMM|nr:tRNA dihydrouridine(20/20a) synthase DusA [Endozoicomonas elysicola]KEI71299.1 tRNA-dihydrouridine synthase A [Endozoicomonas elysicola]
MPNKADQISSKSPVIDSNSKVSSHSALDRTFMVAPMMDWTDRHCRYFHRVLSERALLYTEMVTTGALVHGDKDRFLQHDAFEYPLAVQLGGHDDKDLAFCAGLAEERGYQEVNLNVGCPSDRVQNGRIGACLMAEPDTVAKAIRAMKEQVSIPVTVKHRIGINGRESWQELVDFVGTVAEAGCETFIVHARIAVLEGLSPKENRDIPPLKPDWVYELKRQFPALNISINGGIKTFEEIDDHLQQVDGVMLGREAYQNPYLLSEVDGRLYGSQKPVASRSEVVEKMIPYIESELSKGTWLSHITRHMLGLYHGVPGGRRFRRHISENAHKPKAGVDVLLDAVGLVESL